MDGQGVSRFEFVTCLWVLFWEEYTRTRGYPSCVRHHWLGGVKEPGPCSGVFLGGHSEHTGSAGWYGGRAPYCRCGDWLLIPSPTLSRCMIMGNSFNCLTIIDFTGGRALDLESRNLDTWLHTSLAGRLQGKPLSLSGPRFFSYTITGIIFTNYLTELWWEYDQIMGWKHSTGKGYTEVGDHFCYLSISVSHCLSNPFYFLLTNRYIFATFVSMENWSMGVMWGAGIISLSTQKWGEVVDGRGWCYVYQWSVWSGIFLGRLTVPWDMVRTLQRAWGWTQEEATVIKSWGGVGGRVY